MKTLHILLVLIFTIVLNGCTGVKSTTIGLDNESFLSFYSDKKEILDSNIDVKLGDRTTFSAEVNAMRRNSTNFEKRPKGKVYSIKPGANHIKVTHNGKLIYSKKIFISNQETKIIKL